MFRKGGKVVVQGGFIPAASGHGGLQIVRDDGQRSAAHVMQGVLTGRYQVLFSLTHDRFDIGKLAARENGHKNLDREYLAAVSINDGELVAGEVYEKLVTGLVFQMHDGVGHAYMALDKAVETGKAVTVRMLGYIFLVQFAATHAFMTQTFAVGRQK